MARKVQTIYVDDLTGDELHELMVDTIGFSLDGVDYVIDLSVENAERFREAVDRYVKAARKTSSWSRKSGRRS